MYYVIGKDNCPWCQKAKALLDKPGNPPYVYKNLDRLPEIKREFWVDFIKNELSKTTVPVIINVVGGYEDLEEELNDY
jgi:glutaredoxin